MNADMVKALAANIAVPTVEAWDPATSSWTTLPPMATARRNAAVGLLPDGRVIVAGGCTPNQGLRIFDASTFIVAIDRCTPLHS